MGIFTTKVEETQPKEERSPLYEDTPWSRERFKKMDEAPSVIDPQAAYIKTRLEDIREALWALSGITTVIKGKAISTIITALANDMDRDIKIAAGICEEVNEGLTVQEKQ